MLVDITVVFGIQSCSEASRYLSYIVLVLVERKRETAGVLGGLG
jgi:hypothetical protein